MEAMYWRPTRTNWQNILLRRRTYLPYCVVSAPRSGTNLLRHCLNVHPHIVMHGEIFNPAARVRQWEVEWIGDELPIFDNHPVDQYLNEYIYPRSIENMQAVGFKLFPYHFNRLPQAGKAWSALTSVPSLKILHMKRNNFLDSAISIFVAKRDDKWLGYGDKAIQPPPISIPFEALAERIDSIGYMHGQVQKRLSGFDILPVSYDDLAANPDETLDRIQRWMGVEPMVLRPARPLRKQRRWTRAEAVEGYDELRERFRRERPDLAHFFDEPETFHEVPSK